MKALGKIGDIQIAYQQEKSRDDGSKYWGERYTIYLEVGDDVHMIDSGWLHCQGKDGGRAILENNRGIKVGAIGEAIFRYGFRDWTNNGITRRFSECTLVKFTPMAATQQGATAATTDPTPAAPAAQPEATAQEVAEGMAEAAAQIDPETGLPF